MLHHRKHYDYDIRQLCVLMDLFRKDSELKIQNTGKMKIRIEKSG